MLALITRVKKDSSSILSRIYSLPETEVSALKWDMCQQNLKLKVYFVAHYYSLLGGIPGKDYSVYIMFRYVLDML